MSVVWLIAKFALYTFILKVLFAQTFNFIFMLAKRPGVWIVVVALLGVANMALAYALSWDPRLVSAATLTAVILNIPSLASKGILSKTELHTAINEAYQEWGIKHGRLKYTLGLIAFAVFSLAAYVACGQGQASERRNCRSHNCTSARPEKDYYSNKPGARSSPRAAS